MSAVAVPKSPTASARALAEDIKARRNGLASEVRNLKDHPTYVRAQKYRDQDEARINGMVIALTYMLGEPMDMARAEAFIARMARAEAPVDHYQGEKAQTVAGRNL